MGSNNATPPSAAANQRVGAACAHTQLHNTSFQDSLSTIWASDVNKLLLLVTKKSALPLIFTHLGDTLYGLR